MMKMVVVIITIIIIIIKTTTTIGHVNAHFCVYYAYKSHKIKEAMRTACAKGGIQFNTSQTTYEANGRHASIVKGKCASFANISVFR